MGAFVLAAHLAFGVGAELVQRFDDLGELFAPDARESEQLAARERRDRANRGQAALCKR